MRRSAASSWRRCPARPMNAASTSTRAAAPPTAVRKNRRRTAPTTIDVRSLGQLLDPGRGLPDRDRHRRRPPVGPGRAHRDRGQPPARLELAQLRRPGALAPHHHQVQPRRARRPTSGSTSASTFAAALRAASSRPSRFAWSRPSRASLQPWLHSSRSDIREGEERGKRRGRGDPSARRTYRRGGTATAPEPA